MHDGRVLGAHVLTSAHPILDSGSPVVAPRLERLQRRTTDMQQKRCVGLGESSPEGLQLNMAWCKTDRSAMRDPDCFEAVV